jgi:hypothetical protein
LTSKRSTDVSRAANAENNVTTDNTSVSDITDITTSIDTLDSTAIARGLEDPFIDSYSPKKKVEIMTGANEKSIQQFHSVESFNQNNDDDLSANERTYSVYKELGADEVNEPLSPEELEVHTVTHQLYHSDSNTGLGTAYCE